MALFLLTECIDEGLCGCVALEAPTREAALAFILLHWERLKGGFGGCYMGLDDHLRRSCRSRGVAGPPELTPADLEDVLKRAHIDGDSEAGYDLREVPPIDTTAGPPPVLNKHAALLALLAQGRNKAPARFGG